MAEEHDPRQQAQTAGTGHHQGHVGAPTGIGAVVPVADQQERKEAGQLPEKHHLNQVAGDHQPEHGTHECQEKGKKAWHRVFRRHVVTRIERYQGTDAQHQQGEQPGETVQAQDEVQAQAGQPEVLFAYHTAVGDLRVQQGHLEGADQGDQSGENRFSITCVVWQQCRQTAANKWQKQ
ncbi:hypothetical protein D3C84_221750 [compost metagenome]